MQWRLAGDGNFQMDEEGIGFLANQPRGLLGASGLVVVADRGNNQILVLDSLGHLQRTTGDGQGSHSDVRRDDSSAGRPLASRQSLVQSSTSTNGARSIPLCTPQSLFAAANGVLFVSEGDRRLTVLDGTGEVRLEVRIAGPAWSLPERCEWDDLGVYDMEVRRIVPCQPPAQGAWSCEGAEHVSDSDIPSERPLASTVQSQQVGDARKGPASRHRQTEKPS